VLKTESLLRVHSSTSVLHPDIKYCSRKNHTFKNTWDLANFSLADKDITATMASPATIIAMHSRCVVATPAYGLPGLSKTVWCIM